MAIARAIIQGRTLNEVLGNTLKLFAQIALQSIFQTVIGTATGGGSGLLGAIFGDTDSAAAPTGGLSADIQQLRGNIRALSGNIGAQQQQPIILNVGIGGEDVVRKVIKPEDIALNKAGVIIDTTT